MEYKKLVFSFEKGGNPDPYQIVMDLQLQFAVNFSRKELATVVEADKVDSVKELVTQQGYQFVKTAPPWGDD